MKSPITGKIMTLQFKDSSLVFRKESFSYRHVGYYCEDSKEVFTTTELDEMNLNQVYNKYRDKYNIPFPDEIRELRKKYSLPASKMSLILGFGPHSYGNYEKGEVPSRANANYIQAILKNTEVFKNLVYINTEIKPTERNRLLKSIDRIIVEENQNFLDEKYIQKALGDNLPDAYSGYRRTSVKKLSEMIVFFTHQMQPHKTAMNKLLWYADFLYFRKSAFSISGVRYMAHNHGPVPLRFRSLFDYVLANGFVDIITEDYGSGYIGERFLPCDSKSFDKDIFNESEISVLLEVSEKFKGCNATQIRKKSHEEKAWLDNEKNKNIIDYDYSFFLKHI